jgi:hypothetical protein
MFSNSLVSNCSSSENLALCKGYLGIQYAEGATIQRYCILERYVLNHFDVHDLTKSKSCSRLHLHLVPVLEVAPLKFKAICVTRSLATESQVDYVYFTVLKADQFPMW